MGDFKVGVNTNFEITQCHECMDSQIIGLVISNNNGPFQIIAEGTQETKAGTICIIEHIHKLYNRGHIHKALATLRPRKSIVRLHTPIIGGMDF
jgi:hypothetical protein